jgi:hypothetical protein
VAKYLFIAQSDCGDPKREQEFNEWLDSTHIPDVLDLPGIVRAARYINTDPAGNKRPKYVAVYEIETDDINKFDQALHQRIKQLDAAGRVLNVLVPEKAYPFATTYYMQVNTFEKPAAKNRRK